MFSETFNGLQIIASNEENYPAFDLEGFSVKPGEIAKVRIIPTLYDVTPIAESRFDDEGKLLFPKICLNCNLFRKKLCQRRKDTDSRCRISILPNQLLYFCGYKDD